jgi:hypothetical protein
MVISKRCRNLLVLGSALALVAALLVVKRARRFQFPMVGKSVAAMTLPLVANSSAGSVSLPAAGVTVLEFFESTCVPCSKTLPTAQHRIEDPAVSVYVVSMDPTREAAVNVAREWGLVKPVVWDQDWIAKRQLQIMGIPAFVVLAANGTVTGWFPYSPSDSELEAALDDAKELDPS